MGDIAKNIVHDQARDNPTCEIDEIDINFLKFFDPDTLDQAKSEHFKLCDHCLRFEDQALG